MVFQGQALFRLNKALATSRFEYQIYCVIHIYALMLRNVITFLLFVLCATSGNIRPRYNEVSMVILLPPDHGDYPWVWDMVTSGQLFTVRGGGRLAEGSRGVSKPRDGCYADRIALKFDRHSGSTSEVPVKFQSDWRNLNPSLADSRPRGVLGWGVGRPLLVNGGSRVGSDLLRWAQCCVHWSLG